MLSLSLICTFVTLNRGNDLPCDATEVPVSSLPDSQTFSFSTVGSTDDHNIGLPPNNCGITTLRGPGVWYKLTLPSGSCDGSSPPQLSIGMHMSSCDYDAFISVFTMNDCNTPSGAVCIAYDDDENFPDDPCPLIEPSSIQGCFEELYILVHAYNDVSGSGTVDITLECSANCDLPELEPLTTTSTSVTATATSILSGDSVPDFDIIFSIRERDCLNPTIDVTFEEIDYSWQIGEFFDVVDDDGSFIIKCVGDQDVNCFNIETCLNKQAVGVTRIDAGTSYTITLETGHAFHPLCSSQGNSVSFNADVTLNCDSAVDDSIVVPQDPLPCREAQEYCKNIYGTNLATISTDADRAEAVAALSEAGEAFGWIGLYSDDVETKWQFRSGEQCPSDSAYKCVDFWLSAPGGHNNRPRCIGQSENGHGCAVFYRNQNGVDNDIPSGTPQPFLCDSPET